MSTNATVFDEPFLGLILDGFYDFGLSFSIDGVGEQYEYLRRPGKWTKVAENLRQFQKFKATRNNFYIQYTFTLSWLNAWYLPEFHEWLNENTPGLSVWHNIIYAPAELSLKNAPATLKKAILKKWDNYNFHEKYHGDINALKNILRSEEALPWRDVLSFVTTEDLARKESWRKSFCEIVQFCPEADGVRSP